MATGLITDEATSYDMLVEVAGNSERALQVCRLLLQLTDRVDPDDPEGGLGPLMALDRAGLYGSRIVRLYDLVCDEDITAMIALLRALDLGLAGVTKEALVKAIDWNVNDFDIEAVERAVKDALPRFRLAHV